MVAIPTLTSVPLLVSFHIILSFSHNVVLSTVNLILIFYSTFIIDVKLCCNIYEKLKLVSIPQTLNELFEVMSPSHKTFLTLRAHLKISCNCGFYENSRLKYPHRALRHTRSTQIVTIAATENPSIFGELVKANLQ